MSNSDACSNALAAAGSAAAMVLLSAAAGFAGGAPRFSASAFTLRSATWRSALGASKSTVAATRMAAASDPAMASRPHGAWRRDFRAGERNGCSASRELLPAAGVVASVAMIARRRSCERPGSSGDRVDSVDSALIASAIRRV